jgi:hypothetical protein
VRLNHPFLHWLPHLHQLTDDACLHQVHTQIPGKCAPSARVEQLQTLHIARQIADVIEQGGAQQPAPQQQQQQQHAFLQQHGPVEQLQATQLQLQQSVSLTNPAKSQSQDVQQPDESAQTVTSHSLVAGASSQPPITDPTLPNPDAAASVQLAAPSLSGMFDFVRCFVSRVTGPVQHCNHAKPAVTPLLYITDRPLPQMAQCCLLVVDEARYRSCLAPALCQVVSY